MKVLVKMLQLNCGNKRNRIPPPFSLKRLFLSSCHEQDQTRFMDADGVGHQSFVAGNKLAKIVCKDTSAPLTDHNSFEK